MAATVITTLLILISAINGFTCPASQQSNTHQICKIFQSTNIENVTGCNMSNEDYCNWQCNPSPFQCIDPNSSIITTVYATNLNGTLNFEYQWPDQLFSLSLIGSSKSSSRLYGEWNWTSMQQLSQLIIFNIDGNQFSNTINNHDWGIIASLPKLSRFEIQHNLFRSNLSAFNVDNSIKSNITVMWMQNNKFFGDLNGFFSTFPKVSYFYIHENGLTGLWPNFDQISSGYLPYLFEFIIGNNSLSGSVTLSDGLSLNASLSHFEISDNSFSGSVSWRIFENLNSLVQLRLDGNDLHGFVNLTSLPTSLQVIRFDYNYFNGTINWDPLSSFDNLKIFNIDDNYLDGSIAMTQGLQLPESLMEFDVDHNYFHGQIQWDIFDALYSLEALDLNYNYFNGTINWAIIADLHNNGSLQHIELHDNYFSGYVDFSWIKDDVQDFYLQIDEDIPCDPIIHPCENSTHTQGQRNINVCYNRTHCESSCHCIQKQPTVQPTIQPSAHPTITPTERPSISENDIPTRDTTSIPTNMAPDETSHLPTPITTTAKLNSASTGPLNPLVIIIIVLIVLLICAICLAIFFWKRSRNNTPTNKPPSMNIKHSIEFHGAVSIDDNLKSFAAQHQLTLESRVQVHSNEGALDDMEGDDKLFDDTDQPGSPNVERKDSMENGKHDMIVEADEANDDDEEEVFTPRSGKDTPGSIQSDEMFHENRQKIIKYSFNSDADMEVIADIEDVMTPKGNEDDEEVDIV